MVRAGETGQGQLVSHQGNCYVLTAAHVVGNSRRAQVLTSAGEEANATMQRPFWEGFDVAVGVLRAAPPSGCGPTSQQFFKNTGRATPGKIATLPFVAPGGVVNVPVRVDRINYLEITGQIDDPAQAAQKGLSGGFLVMDGKPLGMARAVDPDGTLNFVRIEEIIMNLDRWFNHSGLANETEVSPPPAQAAAVAPRLELVSSSPPSIGVDHTADVMLAGEGSWIPGISGTTELVMRNLAPHGAPPTLSRLWVEAETGEAFATPKRYRVDIAASEAIDPKWRLYAVGEMPPDGVLDTGLKAKMRANMIRIQVLSTWGEGQIGIRSVKIE